MSDSIITIDEMRQNRNKCFYGRCLECKNADMLHVERSNCYIRCGCKTGKHFGTWSTGYPFVTQTEVCPDFSKIVDEKHKRMVNLAWIISCERKMMCFRRPATRPVSINNPYPSHKLPFPEAAAKVKDETTNG